MEFNGLPLHPLIVHVVVVFAPLASVGGILYAAVPKWRWWLRWPLVATAVVAAAAAIISVRSGQDLETQRPQLQTLPGLATHAQRGRFLRWVLLAFLAPIALAAWQLRGPAPLSTDGSSPAGRTGVAAWVIQALLVAGSITVLVCVFLTGDSGARSVWGG